MTAISAREDRRQFVHLGTTACALLLPWLPHWAAYAICGAAILLWWVVLPATGRRTGLERDDEPLLSGLRTYPIAVLLVLVLFPWPAAAAAWGVMGVGDAMSNLVGRRLGRPGLLGRQDRSLAGTLAFVVSAWPAAWGLAAWLTPSGSPTLPLWLPALAAAAAGALTELVPLPRRLDDNVPIAIVAAAAYHVTALQLA